MSRSGSSAVDQAPRLCHHGVLYRDVDELVDLVAPQLEGGLRRSGAVIALVDAHTADLLRLRIGPDAEAITFPDPGEAFAEPVQPMVARRRR